MRGREALAVPVPLVATSIAFCSYGLVLRWCARCIAGGLRES